MNRTLSPTCDLAALTQVFLSTSLRVECPVAVWIRMSRRVLDAMEHDRCGDEPEGSTRVVEADMGRRYAVMFL